MIRPSLRLLFLSQTLPYPPDAGAKVRTFHLLRLLARRYEITALCFYRAKSLRTNVELAVDHLRQFARVEAFPIRQEHSALRTVWDHVQSVACQRAYTAFVYDSSSFRQRLRRVLSERWDIVHADSLDLSRYFGLIAHLPVVCGHHDVQSDLLRRRAEREPGPLRREYFRLQSRLMANEEQRWCDKVALNLTVSERDRALLEQTAGGRYVVIPNGVDTTSFVPASDPGSGCLFLGAASWFPNRDAMKFFTADILPHIRRVAPETTVRWVGDTSQADITYFSSHGVDMLGHVVDSRVHVARSACCLVPIRVGGGTRIKILEAWAMGKAVVSTSVGCEGLDARDGDNIIVRDDPRAFADAVVRVLRDPVYRAKLGDGGRRTAESVYDWEIIGEKLTATYAGLFPHRQIH